MHRRAWPRSRHGVKDGLDVGGRSGNGAQDGPGRGLLFECFAQFAVAGLNLLEQPHILDGDHRLVGEDGEQLDLLLGERPHFKTANDEGANSLLLAQQWHCKYGPVTEPFCHRLARRKLVRGGGEIVHMNRLAIHESPSGHPVTADRPIGEVDRNRAVMRFPRQRLAVLQQDSRIVSIAELGRAFRDCVQYRLRIGG